MKRLCVYCLMAAYNKASYMVIRFDRDTTVQLKTVDYRHDFRVNEPSIIESGWPTMWAEFLSHLVEMEGWDLTINMARVAVVASFNFFGTEVCATHLWNAREDWRLRGNGNYALQGL